MKTDFVRCLRFGTHPIGIGLALGVTIFLWMPFGMGYYGWPWEIPTARVIMVAFVVGVPIYAAISCAVAPIPKPSLFRFGLSVCTLWVGLYGALAMFHWLNVYSGPPPYLRKVSQEHACWYPRVVSG